MRVLDAGCGSVVWTVACHDAAIVGIAASPDARRLLCISRCDLTCIRRFRWPADFKLGSALQGNRLKLPQCMFVD